MPPIAFKTISINGDTIDFPKDFKNKYVLLDFWNLRCGPCVHEIKENYIDLFKRYTKEKFEIIGITNNSKNELIDFLNSNQIEWINIADKEGKRLIKLYDVYMYPTVFLIGPNGEIIHAEKDLRGQELRSILENCLK